MRLKYRAYPLFSITVGSVQIREMCRPIGRGELHLLSSKASGNSEAFGAKQVRTYWFNIILKRQLKKYRTAGGPSPNLDLSNHSNVQSNVIPVSLFLFLLYSVKISDTDEYLYFSLPSMDIASRVMINTLRWRHKPDLYSVQCTQYTYVSSRIDPNPLSI